MHAHVSKEEWVFRGLAIAMCLAMMGMAVMPLAVGDLLYKITHDSKVAGAGFAVGTGVAGRYIGPVIATAAASAVEEGALLTALGVATGGTALILLAGIGTAY